MKVKNLNGTTDNTCKCGSWLQHWKNYSNQKANSCVVYGCNGNPEVGGHVQKDSVFDSSWYIIPICKACNNKRGQELVIYDQTVLVPANKSLTCD